MRNRSIVQIGCLVLVLFVAPQQPTAAGGDRQKANPRVYPSVASRVLDRVVANYKEAPRPSGAVASRMLVSATVSKERTPAATGAAGQINHLQREAIDARRVSPAATPVSRSDVAPVNRAAQRVAPESQPSQKQSMSSAAARQRVIQPDLK